MISFLLDVGVVVVVEKNGRSRGIPGAVVEFATPEKSQATFPDLGRHVGSDEARQTGSDMHVDLKPHDWRRSAVLGKRTPETKR